MTREEVAERINWDFLISIVGVVNPFIMAPQLHKMWTIMDTTALSAGMLGIILFVQTGFAVHGYFIRDKFFLLSNIAAALMSATTLISIPLIQALVP